MEVPKCPLCTHEIILIKSKRPKLKSITGIESKGRKKYLQIYRKLNREKMNEQKRESARRKRAEQRANHGKIFY